MKKIITLGFMLCAGITSSTMFGMLVRQLQNHTKRFAIPQRKSYSSTEILLMQLTTAIEKQNSLLKQEITNSQTTNKKIDMLIKNQTKTNQQQHRLIEMEDLPYESKYHRELTAYHEQLSPKQ